MLIINHGDNTEKTLVQSQIVIKEFKSKGYEIKNISSDPGSFTKELTETGLFETKKLIIVDNFKSLTKRELDLIKAKKYSPEVSLLISISSLLTAIQIKSLGKPDRLITNIYPKLLWNFIDSFYPGNSKACIKLFNEVVKTEAPELVLFLLTRHLKDLFIIKNKLNPGSSIQPWKLSKLKNIAENFDIKLLKDIIKEVADIDIKSKSTDADLKASIDLLIVSKLQ